MLKRVLIVSIRPPSQMSGRLSLQRFITGWIALGFFRKNGRRWKVMAEEEEEEEEWKEEEWEDEEDLEDWEDEEE